MTDLSPMDFLWITAICGPLAFAVLWGLDRVWRREPVKEPTQTSRVQSAYFLFRDDELVDHDARYPPFPGNPQTCPDTWQDLRDWLGERFGHLPVTLAETGITGPETHPALAAEDPATLEITAQSGARRVALHDHDPAHATDRHQAKRVEQALLQHVQILDHAPCAIAMMDSKGALIWRNAQFAGFSDPHAERLLSAADALSPKDRICLSGGGLENDQHMELSCLQLGDMTVLYVTDVTKVAEAETVRREFIQTLTKTFANLTTGLAVFDRHRRLALFNPALLDLTDLPATFLSAQPPLAQFFDRLRDNKMLPEPRNYGSWRAKIDEMITSASDGRYQEDWHLVNGLTYRVTGRPHPDGAIAFLFEDISDEVAMTRQIRTQLDVRQATLDTLDRAIAVIGPDRSIILCNRTCTELLGIDPDGSFADMCLGDFLTACHTRLTQHSIWSEVEKAVLYRQELEQIFRTAQGAVYRCQVTRIPGKKMTISIMPEVTRAQDMTPKTKLPA